MGVRLLVIEIPQIVENDHVYQVANKEQQDLQEDHEAALRMYIRVKRSTIPSDYVVYMQESNYNIGAANDLESFS